MKKETVKITLLSFCAILVIAILVIAIVIVSMGMVLQWARNSPCTALYGPNATTKMWTGCFIGERELDYEDLEEAELEKSQTCPYCGYHATPIWWELA